MQRRVMSHNPKRLPRRLREAHIDMQLKSGIPNIVKTPRRKYRRLPQNPLPGYNRRQRRFVWLETHIWHAKRFHMVEKWGYKLANFPNDKSFRACYRACKEHCLLQDISYFSCIEIFGELDNILKGLNQLTSTECGLTFGAKCSLQGTRECSTTVFRMREYPNGVIGSVKFMWKPPGNDSRRTLWVWCHAAYYSELFDELVKVFSLKNIGDCEEMDVDCDANEKSESENSLVSKIPKYSSTEFDVTVSQLKDTLNRFRLTGPLSQPILTDLLRVIDPDKLSASVTDSTLENARLSWAHSLLDQPETVEILKKKKDFWGKMKLFTEPSQLPPYSVIPLTVSDPRYHMPQIRTKQVTDTEGQSGIWPLKTIPADFVQDNAMWEPSIRDKSRAEKLSTAELNLIKSDQLVPGACDLENLAPASYLPVILIQNPGFRPQFTKKGGGSSWGGGWDVVAPAGWAMPLWLGMVWRGARVGGLRESASMAREAGALCLPPDSAAGQQCDAAERAAKTDVFFRKPPAKRPNYIKLGIPTPFHRPWKELIRDWNGSENTPSTFCVLRSIAALQNLNSLLQELRNLSSSALNERLLEIGLEVSSFLVAVNVRMCKRGNLCENSTLCLPLMEDVEKLKENGGFMGPVEPSHVDIYEDERRSARETHQKQMIRLRKKRKAAKDKNSAETLKVLKETTDLKVKEERALMQRLWLPTEIGNLRNGCSREVMGFLENGAFSYKEACSTGQGYIALTALLKFCSHWKTVAPSKYPLILVRSPFSYQYSFAELSIIL
ncbi:hypothetical protein LSTR_LSTR013804 [Laodelphax striatellus]|uniref:Uncharacterized protein n=1 Tax=Laodelphax striatellus TaxID=195883 RepID=A0A482WUG6_LAOST|nr:hypothetical protein LSTR_LSTR013804 [Laodelphax striatellus]